jgi:hypothetical protein
MITANLVKRATGVTNIRKDGGTNQSVELPADNKMFYVC